MPSQLSNNWVRGIQIEQPLCFCAKETATMDHLLLQCDCRTVWLVSSLTIRVDHIPYPSLKDWIWHWIAKTQSVPMEYKIPLAHLISTLWSIWSKQKKNMFDQIQPNPFSVLHNASYQLSSILIAWKYLQQDIITNTAAKLTKTNQGRWRGRGIPFLNGCFSWLVGNITIAVILIIKMALQQI